MKKVVKALLIIILILAVLLTIGYLYISTSEIPSYENQAPDIQISSDSLKIEEGARIASMVCNSCHLSKNQVLEGNYMPDAKVFGEIFAPNITNHPEFGIGSYTDGELVYLLRTGIKKDGVFTPPYMPKLPHLSDHDMECLISFLRSDHRWVRPSEVQQPESEPSFLTKFLCKVAVKPLPYPQNTIVEPDTSDLVAFGKYLSTAKFDCYSCHSKDFATVDLMVPEKSEGFFGGGNKLYDREGNIVLSPNITMHKEAGIGSWNEDEFHTAMRSGMRPDNTSYKYPMMPFTALTDRELSAIWAYLNAVPVLDNAVPRSN